MIKKGLIVLEGDPLEISDVILQKGRGYALHSLCACLQKHPTISHPLSDYQLGIVYSSVALSQPRNTHPYLLPADENLVRGVKRRFQETCRSNLYLLFHHLAVGEKQFEELAGEYLANLDKALALPAEEFQESGLKQEVYSKLTGEKLEPSRRLEAVAQAVKRGAEEFHKDFFQKGKDRRFIEYNSILKELRRI